jgi:iron complex outermembrane receptor protein
VEGGWEPLGRGVFSCGNTFTNGLDLFLSGHYQAGTGESRLSFGRWGTAHHADEQRLSDGFLSAKYDDFFLQFWFANQRKEIPTGPYGTILGDDRTFVDNSMELAELRWQRAVTDKLTVLGRGYGAAMRSDGQYLYADPAAMYNGEHTRDQWTGFEAQVNWQPWDAHRFTAGAVYEHHWTSLAGDYRSAAGAVTAVYPGFHDNFDYWALYAQDEICLLTNLCLTVGGRYDAYPHLAVDRLTPRGAVVWNPVAATTVKLLYGTAFRAPSQLHRLYPGASGTGPANPGLGCERITTYELALEQDFQHGLLGRVSVFHNDASRLVGAASDFPNPVIYANLFNVRTTGVEAELSQKFTNGFRGFINGTWQNSVQSSGALLNSPHWLANAGLVLPLAGDKLTLALRENFVSERNLRVPGRRTGDAWTTDLVLNCDQWAPHWSFNIGLYNLFDARPTVPAGADGTLDEIPQPGRAVIARATFHF